MYKFSEYSRNIINGDKVVLANRQTGQWVRISKEVFDILNLGIDNDLSINELRLNLYDDDDRKYIDDLYKRLCSIGIIEDENNKQVSSNKIVSFEMTHRCNLKCIHCCIDADGIVSDKKDLTTEEAKKVLNKLIEWNPERIMLSGGEPMLRRDFIELLTYLYEHYNGKIIILTNGTLINNENVDILVKCAYQIDISLDGVDEETCSIIRGPGIFNKVINSVQLLKSRQFKNISLSMVFGDKNDYLKDKFIELNKSLQTYPLIRQFKSVGRGVDSRVIFSDRSILESTLTDSFLNGKFYKKFNSCSCTAAKKEFFITYNGDIYPCQSFIKSEYRIDNIRNIDKLSDLQIYKNKYKKVYSKLEKFNPEKYIDCKDCKVNLFCWPCPAEIEQLKDSKEAFNDTCKKIKPILYKEIWGEIL
ncbi:radical SAM additional 4Fe4S-binding SPASM domain protein [Clostridium argentinense CDC 2741]|uniref:Radical SAM additional 4Fe4S-binding SPASM domain protein n=2 Tax=Clostridium argentinense TaxID=29341 RepID=A0A0C1TW13_9CLOT|nr:radical SAM protein [Clostridium argentinense]ARC83169.1 radical SAM/SPASM domain-containing protein [Clostridium argentinense]KIE44919.1 radical SAM additional 4Fe4S-binding SPASM domain protein [Clostridium argentinense CDC 2741]NFF41413.1 radical SAM protein [Clostridium argentinense]NFP52077.1 radical SAM protein [Clostridium argentinense]NFP74427.1 radical SAM protein [Clostridium argentinense]